MKVKTILVSTMVASALATTAGATTQSTTLAQMQQQLNALQSQVAQMNPSPTVVSKKSPKIGSKKSHLASSDSSYLKSESSILGNSVVLAPFTSKPTFYSGGRLVVNAPSINEDAKLLYRRFLGEDRSGLSADHPRLVLSGKVESEATYTNPYTGRYTSDLNLSGVELDAFAEVSQWVNGFMAFSYDNTAATNNNTMVGNSNRRINNSRIYLDKGFITIGNFHQSGVYGSVGQLVVPFGRYGSSMIASPLTEAIGKTKARAVTLSYITGTPDQHKMTPYIHTFVFKGDTRYGSRPNTIKNYGTDVGMFLSGSHYNGDVGLGYLNNMADSNGAQDNGRATGFMGFDQSSSSGNSSENIVHRVGATDLHGSVGYGSWSGIAEYVTSLQRFALTDMTYDGHRAKPNALNLEGAYAFTFFNLPSSVALGYGFSRQALALNIPYQRYTAAWSVTCLKVIVLTLEARHDINYSKNDTATGRVSATTTASAVTANQLGRTDNALTARIGVYF